MVDTVSGDRGGIVYAMISKINKEEFLKLLEKLHLLHARERGLVAELSATRESIFDLVESIEKIRKSVEREKC